MRFTLDSVATQAHPISPFSRQKLRTRPWRRLPSDIPPCEIVRTLGSEGIGSDISSRLLEARWIRQRLRESSSNVGVIAGQTNRDRFFVDLAGGWFPFVFRKAVGWDEIAGNGDAVGGM